MKNTASVPSSPDGLSPTVLSEGQNRVRRSAAMIGLAISMSATSLLLANQSQAALAAGPLTSDLTSNLKTPPSNDSSAEKASEVTYDLPSLKYEVKEGENIWNIAKKYEISPDQIANFNNISLQAELAFGQILKIPALATKSATKVSSQEWKSSLDNLRATRERLQESLIALRSEHGESTTSTTIPVTGAESPTTGREAHSEPKAILNVEIPVESPPASTSSESNIPIPVTVENPVLTKTSEGLPVPTPQQTIVPANTLAILHRDALPQPRILISEEKPLYRVQTGDTLNNIARRYGISPQELAKANQIHNPNLIKINQALVIPRQTASLPASKQPSVTSELPALPRPAAISEQVETTESTQTFAIPVESAVAAPTQKLRAEVATLQQIHGQEPNLQQPQIERRNSREQLRNPEWKQEQIISSAAANVENYNESLRIPIGATVEPEIPGLSNPNQYLPETAPIFNGYIWPAKGVLTSGYGYRWGRMHRGIDIAGPIGTPIVAAADGEVVSSGWNSGGYGNLVKVKHSDGSLTLYAHNHRLLVRRGEKVAQGQQLAEMGSTGYSTGPHLHFEIHPQGGRAVNPMAFLPKSRSN